MKNVKPQVVLIIQARMESTRLPGKVMLQVLGRPLLSYLLERVEKVSNIDQVVVATSENPKDDVIEQYCCKNGVAVFRGDEEDVLDRYLQTSKYYKADIVVRITADCPLIDPKVIELVVGSFLKGDCDYAGNTLKHTFPRGMDTEVFSIETLTAAARLAKKREEREHVTLYIYKHPEIFTLVNIPYIKDISQYRLTVDTQEDFTLIKTIIQMLYPRNPSFSLEDVISLLEENPDLFEINRHVVQKTI